MSAQTPLVVGSSQAAALNKVLAAETSKYQQLVSLTQQEQTALKNNAIQDLEAAISEKQKTLSELSLFGHQRELLTKALLEQFGLASDATLTDLLSYFAPADAESLTTLRETLIDLLEQLILLNHQNSMMINTELKQLQSTFDFVTSSIQANQEPENYGLPGLNQPSKPGKAGNLLNWEV